MKALLLEHDIKICTYDIDFAGHVSNIVYLRWMEDMRLGMFDKYCPLQGFMDRGTTPILVSSEIKYKKSLRLFDKPTAIMWVSEISKVTLTIEAEIYLQGELCTTVRHVGVFVDMATMKPIRVPKEFTDTINAYIEGAAETAAIS